MKIGKLRGYRCIRLLTFVNNMLATSTNEMVREGGFEPPKNVDFAFGSSTPTPRLSEFME